jgi:hypothetical protein
MYYIGLDVSFLMHVTGRVLHAIADRLLVNLSNGYCNFFVLRNTTMI